MGTRKQPPSDLTGIRQRGNRFQVRIFGGTDPATGRQLILTGSAKMQADAIVMRDGFRKQIDAQTAVRTNVTLAVLLAEWLTGHQVEASTRVAYTSLIDNFIVPALGDQTLPTLAKQGPDRSRGSTPSWACADAAATADRSSSTAPRGSTSVTRGGRLIRSSTRCRMGTSLFEESV